MNGSKGSPPTDISSKDETFSQSHQQQQLLPPVSQGNTEDDGIFLRRLRGESEQQQQGAATTAPALPPQSTTTASFKPPAIANHNRTVSWGVASTPPIPPLPSYDGPASDKIETIGINTILAAGPSESEAETYILQAVEKVANRAHQRTHTETDRLLAAIAEEEIKKSMEMENVEEEEEEEEEQDTKEEPDKHPPIMQKQPSHSTLNSSNYRFQNLVNKQIKASTVEGNLFNLTSALAELDGGGSKHSRKDSHSFEITFTAADKLNNAANQMLHGKQQDTTDTIEEETDDLESQPSSRGEALAALEGDIPVEEGGGGGAAGRGATETNSQRKRSSSKRKSGGRRAAKAVKQGAKEEWELFNSFIGQRKAYMKAYAKKIIMSLFLPCLGMAIFLFYLIEHPEQCLDQLANNNTETLATEAPSLNDTMAPLIASSSNATRPPKDSLGDLFTCSSIGSASASWWFLYLVRQTVTFSMALITQSLVIDYLALGSRITLDWFGPIVTLLVVGSKGWPFILIFWAVYDLVLLSGDNGYAHHWLYWQDWFDVFNDKNPSGNVVDNEWNYRIFQTAIFVGVCVAFKRLLLGLVLGRQTFIHYGEQLANVLKNMVLVGEVATLAKEIEKYADEYSFRENKITSDQSVASTSSPGGFVQNIQEMVEKADEEAQKKEEKQASSADAAKSFIAKRNAVPEAPKSPEAPMPPQLGPESGDTDSDSGVMEADPDFTQSEQMKMMELLDAWEEPTTAEEKEEKKVTLAAVLQFRQSLTCMRKKFPFLPAFGPADTRDACIASSQRVYDRLLLRTPHRGELPFGTLALLAKDEKGDIDQEKAKDLIRVFRPERGGSLSKLEFVKSIDAIYKELRLLAANINNSSQMDAAVENLVNVVFYIILGALVINRLGRNPLTLFFSFSSIILAFAFMFGKSAAKYCDGVLFILVQRPYGVGDRIHLSNPMLDTSPGGSSGWIVEKVSLYTTSVYWGATNERATLCNGAISNFRVINAARSPNAVVFVPLKFAINTDYSKIEIFKLAVEQYLKDRPREWLAFTGFRATEVVEDKGFIGYKVIAQHRNAWQQAGSVIESKAQLTSYCSEIAKQLDMRYRSPPLPVDLNIKDDDITMMPLLPGEEEEMIMSGGGGGDPNASPKSAGDALAAITTGLRQRKSATAGPGKGKTDFAALVRLAMAANRNKNKGE